MHDPMTVAFEIYLGKKQRKNGNYKLPIITIWHNDPEKDGTDDSCGWFMHARHGNPEMLKKIKSAIGSNFDSVFKSDNRVYYTGYFTPNSGMPNFTLHGIVLNMFGSAAWEFFLHDRKKHNKWMKENLYDILNFAENPFDSLREEVTGMFRISNCEPWKRDEAISHYANIIYGWILRSNRKWYQHPKWHIHHWSIQFPPFQHIKRRYWDKCCICNKRGFKHSAIGDWYGTKIWHQECDTSAKSPVMNE